MLVTWPQRDPALWAHRFYTSGIQALDLQQWELARKQLESAHAYAPSSTEINLALGNLWLQQQKATQAAACYLAVLQVDPRHKAALSNMGVLALSEKHWDSAVNYLSAAIDVDPSDAKTHYLYARAQFEAGHPDKALPEIQTALRLRPGQREFEDLYELIRKGSQ
jgi:tetratricopeptide (TPR) repeat protein